MEELIGFDLPSGYQKDFLYILPRSHHSLFAYWELSDRKKFLLAQYFECPFESLPVGIRLYNVTGIYFDGSNAHRSLDHQVATDQHQIYLNHLEPEATYVADFGVYTKERQFIPLVRSNSLHLPRVGVCGDGAIPIGVVDEARFGYVHHRISPQFHENVLPYGLR